MESARWLVLSPLVLAVAAGSLAPARLAGHAGGGGTSWDPPPCTTAEDGPPGTVAWYRLDPVLDRTGTLAARRLTLGVGGALPRRLDLAPESFASGPVDGLVLAGEDDGSVSRLRLLDPARGCATPVAESGDVVRSAALVPGLGSLYEHRVDRATREDLGVWRRDLADGAAPIRVLPGLAPDARLGPTFVTDLVVAADGRLVASSCAPAGCRIRVLDPVSGAVAIARDTGPALGVSGHEVVARAACAGWPCPVEAISLHDGTRRTLVASAGAAALADRWLVLETATGRIRVVDVLTGRSSAAPGRDLPLRVGSTATAGIAAPPGWVALAPGARPDGRTTRRIHAAAPTFRHGMEIAR